jgi:uncharacterized membrane protein YccC
MLGWLRRFLTDTDALEQRLAAELRGSEERLSRRLAEIEQALQADPDYAPAYANLAENEQVLRRVGHQIARIEGRTSALGANAPAPDRSKGNDEKQPGTQPHGS